MGEDAPAAPDAGSVPAVLSFQGGDPAFGPGAPFDPFDEVVGLPDDAAADCSLIRCRRVDLILVAVEVRGLERD